ncbi:MAG: hypothetical protein H0W02_04725 [Ktedonobacteraceae bacterium]|nr:hypothetical protein [Ktedonobacteraceae bacterium]
MRITSREYQNLCHYWLPEIETRSGEQCSCSRCRARNRQPWKDLCSACMQAEHRREEERIRAREDHGFVTECTYGCTDQNSAVWIIGCDYYHIGCTDQQQYQLSVTEEVRVVCEHCIQQALSQPFLYQDGVVWMRNIRLIRKVQEAREGTLEREVACLLACLDF